MPDLGKNNKRIAETSRLGDIPRPPRSRSNRVEISLPETAVFTAVEHAGIEKFRQFFRDMV
jgi:hypothetical protein